MSLVKLLIIITIIALILSIILPPIGGGRPHAQRIICTAHQKEIGKSIAIYAKDYKGNYPQLPGQGLWSKELGFAYDLEKPDFSLTGAQRNTSRTITASLYILVRGTYISPKTFVCPYQKSVKEFVGTDSNQNNITELWDFGPNPYKHVSYAMHNPYGKFPANDKLPTGFAVAADMSPWFQNGNVLPAGENGQLPQIIKLNDESTWKHGNSVNHPQKRNIEGQNVIWADGHSSYDPLPNIGVNKDNIFTFQSTDKDPTEQDIQGGTNPTGRSPENDAKSEDDSFLAI